MSELTFPSGVTWEQNYITGGDLAPDNMSITEDNRWQGCKNIVIDDKKIGYKPTILNNYFSASNNLIIPPKFDTSNVTNANYMCSGCSSLLKIPQYNLENVTSASYLFQNCNNLLTAPDLNLKKVTSLSIIFYSCINLTSIGIVDCDSATTVTNFFGYSALNNLINVGGFRNLGAKSSLSGTTSSFIDYMPNLTRQSLLNIFNLLYDRASAGYSVVTLKLHANHHAKLTDEDKAIATNKGWALS